jgi:hypothetical protein
MARLLDCAPVLDLPSEALVQGERVRLRANQVIAWVTLTHPDVNLVNPTRVPFPVILDTGHTHTFSIQRRHLIEWAGVQPDGLPVAGLIREGGHRLELRFANIWLHANEPQSRDRLSDRPPYPVGADRGIAVYPTGVDFPRLPILGLRAITHNRLVLKINGHRREASLRTAFRWWPFASR